MLAFFSQGWLTDTKANTLMFNIGRWVLLSIAMLLALNIIYYFAPASRQRVGFSYNDVLSFTEAPDGRTVIVKREKICDNCAAEKPQRKDAEDTITLFDFLNSLSDEQQKAAFAHLKLKWDRVQGSGLYGRS